MQASLDVHKKITDETPKPYGFTGLCISTVLINIALLFFVGVISHLICVAVAAHLGLQLTSSVIGDPLKAIRQSNAAAASRIDKVIAVLGYFWINLLVLQFARKRGGKAWRNLIAWRPIAFPLNGKALWSICAAALIYNSCAGPVFGLFFPNSISPLVLPSDHLALAMQIASIVVLGPVTEELFFRGWIYTGLRFHWGFWTALLTTSVTFAALHYIGHNSIYCIAVFPVGLALGVLREWTGSIKAGILLHASINFVAFCLDVLNIG